MSVVQLEHLSAAGAKHGADARPFMHLVWCWWIPALIATYSCVSGCWWHELSPMKPSTGRGSRHLDLSYFDHPPMVAYLIWLSTAHLGSTEQAWFRHGDAGVRAILVPSYLRARRIFKFELRAPRRLLRADLAEPAAADGLSMAFDGQTHRRFFLRLAR